VATWSHLTDDKLSEEIKRFEALTSDAHPSPRWVMTRLEELKVERSRRMSSDAA
jgi:hypothetical protein